MNERMIELAERAGLKVESWMTNPPKPFQILGSTEQFEKFAELIVRECAMFVVVELEGQVGSRIADATANRLEQHFGVKE